MTIRILLILLRGITRQMRLRRATVFAVALAALAVIGGCTKEEELTAQQKVCVAGLYPTYDPTKTEACVKVCKTCKKGNTVTCNTSCRLRGAS